MAYGDKEQFSSFKDQRDKRKRRGPLNSLIAAAALGLRVFFRQKLGERSFDLSLIFLSYTWVRAFLFQWTWFDPGIDPQGAYAFFETFLSYIGQFLQQIITIFIEASTFTVGEGSQFIYGYSFFILIFGLIHWGSSIKRNLAYEKWYSYSRGTSVFLGWLEGKTILDGQGEVTKPLIWIVLEPLFIIIVGLVFVFVLEEGAFGLCLIFSALALSVEEYREYKIFRGKLLDHLDAEFEGEELRREIDKFNQSTGLQYGRVSTQGVVLATDNDPKKMQSYINSGGKKPPKEQGARIG